jgi:putative transport protein
MLGFGLLLAGLRVAGVALGSVTGVLVAGLVVGHIGLSIPTASHNIGFLLFIYCIGVQAGPHFVGVFRQDASKYAWLALITAAMGSLLIVWVASRFEWEPGVAAGLLAGALTSTPTLVAAQDALSQGLTLPEGFSQAEVLENISSAYAITYVFGLAGLVIFVSLMPRLFRIDIAEEARRLGETQGLDDSRQSEAQLPPPEAPSIRAYRLERETALGFRVGEMDELFPGEIQRIKRGEEMIVPDPETRLEYGDVVAIVGLGGAHQAAEQQMGPEAPDQDVLVRSVESRNIVISKPEAAGKTLGDLQLGAGRQVWLTQITRSGIPLPRRPELELRIGDVLLLTGARSNLDEVAALLGRAEQ